ncbi:hypothetical protein B0T10DRAFT_566276 [Thelonectria olida]|uniref:Uncharacterized protein n=1 Tax=Thelonectria olida TaxID=1576542 RepID=A0A9P8VUR8_9HYPO|nr:hypothetical protein B0T10DRAFT_566276 [Thelonectria olida]
MDRLLPDMDEIRDTFRPHRDPRERALSARRAYVFFKQHCESDMYTEGGAEMPFILRPDIEAGRFSFLGPAIIAMGVVRKLKDRDMLTYAFPCRGSGYGVNSHESFVLI